MPVERPATPLLCVALDVPHTDDAVALAGLVGPHADVCKVGWELVAAGGMDAVRAVAAVAGPVFADVKLHDIPRTVEAACRAIAALPVRMLTIHLGGGGDMARAALEGVAAGTPAGMPRPWVVGVTVLTSLDDAGLAAAGNPSGVDAVVRARVALAAGAGVDAIVCAPTDLPVVREVAPALVRVTPGVRASGAAGDDQRRTATATQAVEAGSDVLVIGRPIVASTDPAAAAAAIRAEVRALADMPR